MFDAIFFPPRKIRDSSKVVVRDGELIKAMKQLKRQTIQSRLFFELKDRRQGVSKGGRKRIKKSHGIKRLQRGGYATR